jgi:hypothetical protein
VIVSVTADADLEPITTEVAEYGPEDALKSVRELRDRCLVKSRESHPICGGRAWHPPVPGTYDLSPPQKEST